MRPGGDVERLTAQEVGLLAYLGARAGRTVPREALLEHVWGYSSRAVTRAVDVAVRRLRQKIERDPSAPRHLLTVRGSGYRLDLPAPVGASPAPAPGFVGRGEALEALRERLDSGFVLTVTGPPGGGKTRLVQQATADRDARWVSLRGQAPGAVEQRQSRGSGLAQTRRRPRPGQALRGALVVLDRGSAHAVAALAEGLPTWQTPPTPQPRCS
ncbi:MAG: winged helix-turn-helix domain-containing protein [Myxococcota bacterium]